jgi:hypothetical protein
MLYCEFRSSATELAASYVVLGSLMVGGFWAGKALYEMKHAHESCASVECACVQKQQMRQNPNPPLP